jgi:hypothetical protein
MNADLGSVTLKKLIEDETITKFQVGRRNFIKSGQILIIIQLGKLMGQFARLVKHNWL